MKLEHGVFTVSLDFELFWGVRDKWDLNRCRREIEGVWQAVPEMLRTFCDHGIHATWATVGFLFFQNPEELAKHIPQTLPTYSNESLSPYQYLCNAPELEAACHFAPQLIDAIRQCDGQEVGSHTFSHCYCLEEGQTLAQFEDDMRQAVAIAKGKGLPVKSLVFPRNQWNPQYLSTLSKLGIECYRGNESSWMYDVSNNAGQNKRQRLFRFLDAYFNLSGHNTHELSDCVQCQPFNFPASRFLRPYSQRLAVLDGLRLRRIKRAMEDAAKHRRIFHLWWHPHNFGTHTAENIAFLEKISGHYELLKERYGMTSLNMGELCRLPGACHAQ